ncbi:toprim domain-containing protein [Tuwongella immobilis]|uniref:Permeases of the major facilitator superfamily protein: Uncharacterized protein n=1 Tax=Tuwongella immobilis TaxID=692036 RepID=A0A6C2YPC7_9BACT|nr:hypothetical protein [Tuwongella immobilis]VIP03488.1 permeases of the major facilitator superfamily protein : Uncharacterized protein OS=Hyalangium minutum GN=DB31_6149 PE=4 SV=1 [Tuwongella immobilis]VTS04346.1 permeases of the major facilitator superfamily protein : Uncharacterized protein OS=Hyalangium minutum GN=DB31_6149 PE=4 SV=1 [Tuwongella immobilis]
MKCIRCGHDSNYPQRSNRTCPKCQGKFAFEPREGDPISDAGFEQAIRTVSSDGSIAFLEDHLYYDVCRRKARKATSIVVLIILGAIIAGITAFATAKGHPHLIVIAVIPLAILAIGLLSRVRARYLSLTPTAFELLLQRWCDTHGRPERLIRSPMLAETAPQLETDIADYSFDRAVICDRPDTVDFLIANQFHFENNCAVLTVDGYPSGPFKLIRGMLQQNPELQVVTLHDCTPEGCALAHRIATDPEWFGGRKLRILDLGLRPDQAMAFSGSFSAAIPAEEMQPPAIRPHEAKWLNDFSLGLAVIRPEAMLKRVFQAINRNAAQPSTEATAEAAGASAPMPWIIPLGGGGSGSGNDSVVEFDQQSLMQDKVRDGDDLIDGLGVDSFG